MHYMYIKQDMFVPSLRFVLFYLIEEDFADNPFTYSFLSLVFGGKYDFVRVSSVF